ncbi:MAG: UDP-N-acetylmuramoylalanine--D-glutamate ligase [Bacteroidetes bacterium RIFCSPLOWO2_12_FULL_35_15]|nr:MAG: UDP-N-acetylmuramoylalanine--D-glutamate ligase [Bacteroidetes bacterium RIFCSPLOWO2_12_FULL_35_15]
MKRLVILGGGESGVGTAVLAQKKGFDVFLSDKGKIKDKYKDVLSKYRIKWEEEKHSEELILNADEVVKSPGISDKAELIKALTKKGIPVISEIEFAGRYTNAKKICITGSNGKTTTTLLIYHMLKKAGLNVGLAGNVGQSFAMQVAENNFDYYVIELSSFQLDGMFDFKAEIAILLNITPDHLDRYDYKLENYAESKFRIIQNQTSEDAFIYCIDDEVTMNIIKNKKVKAKQFPFSIKQKVETGAFLNENNQLVINTNNTNPLFMTIQELALQGKHNMYNSMAAGVAGKLIDIRKETIRESLSDFHNIDHRLELVGNVHGIEFINDSKATNVNSTWYALESMNNPVILILGGVDKGNDYSMLNDLVKEKVKAIICLGADNKKIIKAFGGMVETIVEANSAKEAVAHAYKIGKKGDTVLLSPACASFDLFENYEDRGTQFKQAVRAL